MPTVDELNAPSGGLLHDALDAGIADISQQTLINFTVYQKVVLPLDGFVFWLRVGSFSQTGAIHWMIDRDQVESETPAHTTVVFTTTEQIQDLGETNTQSLVVGLVADRLYSFRRHGWFFPQAGVWHYQGDGLPSSMSTQLVDDPSQIDPSTLIVSDSLPAWLSLVSYDPVWISWPGERNPHITLYPSFLVPDNLAPPYGSVHIEPSRIEALQVMPWLSNTYSHYQLTRESVRITLYGCNNNQAADFLDLVEQYTLDTDAFGILNMPTIRDGKKPWADGMVIGQQKFIDFEVSYVQTRINNIARQLITNAIATVLPDDLARTSWNEDPGAQGDIQTGLVQIVASLSGLIGGSGGFQATTQGNNGAIAGLLGGSASFGAFANQVIASIKGIEAGTGSIGATCWVLPPSFVGHSDATGSITAASSVTARVSAAVGGAASIQASCWVLTRVAGEVDGVGGISEGKFILNAAAGGEVDGAGNLTGRSVANLRFGGEVDGAATVQGGIDEIVSLGGPTTFFAGGGMTGAATVSSSGPISVVATGIVNGAGSISGAVWVLTAAGAKIDGAGRVSSFANTNGIVSGAALGAAGMSGDVQPTHGQFLAGEVDAAGSISANPSVRQNVAGSTSAVATISGADRVLTAIAGQVDAAGAIAAKANTNGILAGEIDGAGSIAGDASPVVNGGGGTAWFMVGEMDGSGGMSAGAVVKTVQGITSTSSAVGTISGAISILTSGLARATGAGSLSGDARRLAPAGAEIDATASIAGNVTSVQAALGGEIDGAGGISGQVAATMPVGGALNAAGGISANPRRLTPAAGTIAGSASINATIGGIVAKVAGRISGTGSLTAAMPAIQARLAGLLDPDTEFTTEFTDEFGNGNRFFGAQGGGRGSLLASTILGSGNLQGRAKLNAGLHPGVFRGAGSAGSNPIVWSVAGGNIGGTASISGNATVLSASPHAFSSGFDPKQFH